MAPMSQHAECSVGVEPVTVQAAILDTYTDSNTRERRPYEADGLVAATAHLWLQRDVMWARHSHAYAIQYPTW